MTNPIADPLVEVPDTDATSNLVLLEATPEGAATVTLNSPQTRNAFDEEVIGALHETFETLKDSEVRVVFLQGAGGTFSAGANLQWMARAVDLPEHDNRDDAIAMARMLKALSDIPALTVALVDGGAYGGGVGLAAACDMAVATPDATFSFSEVRLGLIPAAISPYVLRAIGPRHAKALFATGRVFSAETAERIGLISEIASDFTAVRERLIADMRLAAPGAVGDAKRLVDDFYGREIDGSLMEESARRIARARVGREGQEGVRAFLAGAKPSWAQD
jgi:methylglutaconyl-CoA hydratase